MSTPNPINIGKSGICIASVLRRYYVGALRALLWGHFNHRALGFWRHPSGPKAHARHQYATHCPTPPPILGDAAHAMFDAHYPSSNMQRSCNDSSSQYPLPMGRVMPEACFQQDGSAASCGCYSHLIKLTRLPITLT